MCFIGTAQNMTFTLTQQLDKNLQYHAIPESQNWSPSAPTGSDVTVEGDEVYTRVGKNLPPQPVPGTIHFLERESRYWLTAQAGLKNQHLFVHGVQSAWKWMKAEHPFTAISPASEVQSQQ